MGVRKRFTKATCTAGAILLVLPAAALGAGSANYSGVEVRLIAGAGDANVVTVSFVAGKVRFNDTGAPITPSPPCVAVDANTVDCAPVAETVRVRVDLGNLADQVTIAPSLVAPFTTILNGRQGADTISGGDFTNDGITGDGSADPPSIDTMNGNGGLDNINGEGGNDILDGGAGVDTLRGGLGDDDANGGPGRDTFNSQSVTDGADEFIGGPGNDTFSYGSRSADLSLTADNVANDGEPGENDNILAEIENLTGGSGDDQIAAGPARNGVSGNGGDDQLDLGAGDDRGTGGSGDDTIIAGSGNDRFLDGESGVDTVNGGNGDDQFLSPSDDESDVLSGGAGVDIVDFAGTEERVRLSLDNAANDGVDGEGDNVRRDIEDAIGGDGRDTMTGSTAANEFFGGRGRDVLNGGGGADGLSGGPGRDQITGGGGRDSLSGGADADLIRSRDSGPDYVDCGGGSDRVIADRKDGRRADCENVQVPRRRGGGG